MGRFSIKDLEQLSGIKAHTIRIWEQRYGIIKPHRTDTNIRYYDDEALKQLLNVSLLNAHGVKISKIAQNCRLSQKISYNFFSAKIQIEFQRLVAVCAPLPLGNSRVLSLEAFSGLYIRKPPPRS